jgi:hypothetical protein
MSTSKRNIYGHLTNRSVVKNFAKCCGTLTPFHRPHADLGYIRLSIRFSLLITQIDFSCGGGSIPVARQYILRHLHEGLCGENFLIYCENSVWHVIDSKSSMLPAFHFRFV